MWIGRRKQKWAGGLLWVVNRDALLAVIPNAAEAEIVLYGMDGQVFVVRFVEPDVRGIYAQFSKKESDGSIVVLAKKRMTFEDARRLWREFDHVFLNMPEVLQPVLSPRRSRRAAMIGGVVGMALAMGVLGWWLGQTGMGPVVGMGSGSVASVAAGDRGNGGPGDLPVAVSAVLRQQGDTINAEAMPSSGVEELPYSTSQLLALHELRVVLQEGRDVPEPLFRQLPEDVRRLLVAEGIVRAPVGEGEGERSALARAPARDGELRRGVGAERDVYGIPAIPPRLPDMRALPPLGGGDLRSVGDFQAFGLQR